MSVVERALMNTLLGMGTVFIVLIFISCLIGCFGLISKSQNKAVKTVTETAAKTVEPVPAVPVPAVVEEAELIDDMALIAVIAAAIAASEGVNPNDLVVRSIRRSRKNWKNA